jgi:hypothetical protein
MLSAGPRKAYASVLGDLEPAAVSWLPLEVERGTGGASMPFEQVGIVERLP